MISRDQRLDRLLPGLSAQERARIMLQDFKHGKEQDRALLHATPEKQTDELNRLIGLMNAANGDLAHLIIIIYERVEKEVLRFSWLEWARMCAIEAWAVRAHFATSATEAITESEHKVKEAEARQEMLPIDECAITLTEDVHVWKEEDFEIDEEGDGSPTDEAWYRERDKYLDQLKTLAADGTLRSEGKGKRLKIECGSFYDWLGLPLPVVPEYGWEYQVLPDLRQDEVDRRRCDHAFIRQLLDRSACSFELPLDVDGSLERQVPPGGFNVEVARVVALGVRTGVQDNWRELRAIEMQLDAMSEAYGGEDVLHPRPRHHFNHAKATLIELHENAQKYTGPFELPEPDRDLLVALQRAVDHEVRNVPTR